MGMSRHEPGQFCWFELGTLDAGRAKTFYSELFGWATDDMPMPGGGGTYTMLRLRGRDVGGLYTLSPEVQPGVDDTAASGRARSRLLSRAGHARPGRRRRLLGRGHLPDGEEAVSSLAARA